MKTIYDWITLGLFTGLVVLFLNRSAMEVPPDRVWHYLPPAIGCALANYLGNSDNVLGAVLTLVLTLGYVVVVLKPFARP